MCHPGWDIVEDISARTFTKQQWFNGPHTMFYLIVLRQLWQALPFLSQISYMRRKRKS